MMKKEPRQIIAELVTLDANPSRTPSMRYYSNDDDLVTSDELTLICITPDRKNGFRIDLAGSVFTALAEWIQSYREYGIGITGWLPESPGYEDGTKPKWLCTACRSVWFTVDKPCGPNPCGFEFLCNAPCGTKRGKTKQFVKLG